MTNDKELTDIPDVTVFPVEKKSKDVEDVDEKYNEDEETPCCASEDPNDTLDEESEEFYVIWLVFERRSIVVQTQTLLFSICCLRTPSTTPLSNLLCQLLNE